MFGHIGDTLPNWQALGEEGAMLWNEATVVLERTWFVIEAERGVWPERAMPLQPNRV